MIKQIIFQCAYVKEHPERATLPFVAATAGIETTVVCTIDAVFLGIKGAADGVTAKGPPVLVNLMAEFRDNGGKVWLCGACTNPHGISEADTVPGVTIVGVATIIEAISDGATSNAFA